MSNTTPSSSGSGTVTEPMLLSQPSMSQVYVGAKSMLPPSAGPPGGGSFISWLSVAMFILFICFLRSSAGPFLNPRVSLSVNMRMIYIRV